MDFYEFLWISIDFYGFLWISMDFYGCPVTNALAYHPTETVADKYGAAGSRFVNKSGLQLALIV